MGELCIDDDSHMRTRSPDVRQIEDGGQSRPHRMYKFTLYETNARYWITGADITDKYFRLLRIDRTSPPGQIALFEDDTVYDREQMNDVLTAIDQGNKATNGLRKKYSFWGMLGFIRFTEAYYMLLITKRKQAAMIGGHYVYQIEATEMVPLTTGSSSSFLRDRNPEEARFLGIMNNVDLSKSFYFSYTYDITHSLQTNMIRQREAINSGEYNATHEFNGMFVWNHHLLKPSVQALKRPYDWCQPIIHGFLDQASLDVFGRIVYVTIIGRRSRFFAGARFLKRGVNDLGYVANDVETEQIVAEKLTTSFHAPGPRLFSNPTYTSYLHHRGSIPLYWSQDNSGVTPKPGIDVNLNDPYYSAAAQHFDNLFERYGCPVYCLNLVKQREKVPRESKLLYEYQKCLDYLNSTLPEGKKIHYKAYDMARAAKTRNSNVIGGLEVIAKEILDMTGFFHNGVENPQVQNGIARTNCIDCLDRTNAAQFVIGKHAFALQLRALGVIGSEEVIDYDTDAVNLFTGMFHDHGDNIAMQYGGSHLVNTMATYRKLGHWQSSSRDMVESFKRYYHNSFLDSQRQEAYNLFLGNYVWAQGQPMLWDLATDYYLHHSDPRGWLERQRRDYTQWYTPAFLERRTMPAMPTRSNSALAIRSVPDFDDYWRECYRPAALSSLQKVYSFKVSTMPRFVHDRTPSSHGTGVDGKYDFSPFVRRIDPHKLQQQNGSDSPEKKPPRKGVKIVAPQEELPSAVSTSVPPAPPPTAILPDSATFASATVATHHRPATADEIPSILRESSVYEKTTTTGTTPGTDANSTYSNLPPYLSSATTLSSLPGGGPVRPADKTQMHLWTLNQFHTQSLHPHVSAAEAWEYERYIAHPLSLPLVVSDTAAAIDEEDPAYGDFVAYVRRAGGSQATAPAASLLEEGDDDDGRTFAAGISDADLQAYWDFVEEVPPDPLTVVEEDLSTKRYKAYRQWLRGKSLFKQSKVDPEYRSGL